MKVSRLVLSAHRVTLENYCIAIILSPHNSDMDGQTPLPHIQLQGFDFLLRGLPSLPSKTSIK